MRVKLSTLIGQLIKETLFSPPNEFLLSEFDCSHMASFIRPRRSIKVVSCFRAWEGDKKQGVSGGWGGGSAINFSFASSFMHKSLTERKNI